jgi:hypothetical protein
VQGNEIVTTSQKSISSVKEADLSPKNYKNLLLLGFFLIAILFLGWLNQGRNNV